MGRSAEGQSQELMSIAAPEHGEAPLQSVLDELDLRAHPVLPFHD
jgi:hypothetical protein